MCKVIKVISGPNGSGKTTFAETFVLQTKPLIPFLNPDLIASGLGPTGTNKASFQAGRILLSEIKEKIKNGDSFAFESTLSGLTYATILNDAKSKGYKIIIYFIFLDKITLNITRIKKRVSQGGHTIPTNIVRRRHLRCFENFWNIYRLISNEWTILNNSNSKPKIIENHISFQNLKEKDQISFSKKFTKALL